MAKKKSETAIAKKDEHFEEISSEIVDSVADDIESTVIELGTRAQLSKVEMVWEVGRTLRKASTDHNVNITELVTRTAFDNRVQNVHMSDRQLWFTVKVYDSFPADTFPDALDLIPGGKSATVTKVKALLTTPAKKEEPTLSEIAARFIKKFGVAETKKFIKELERLIKVSGKK